MTAPPVRVPWPLAAFWCTVIALSCAWAFALIWLAQWLLV